MSAEITSAEIPTEPSVQDLGSNSSSEIPTTDVTTEPSGGNAEPSGAVGHAEDAGVTETAVEVDLDRIAAALDGVDAALTRLADGTYWTDEVTGETIPDETLAADPSARRA